MATKRCKKRQKTSPPIPWPAEYIGKRFPASHLLANTEPLIWKALAHVPPDAFRDKHLNKDEVIRPALHAVGVAWVAMNNQTSRPVKGALYDQAKAFYEENDWRAPQILPQITPVILKDTVLSSSKKSMEIDGRSYVNNCGEWDFTLLQDDSGISAEKDLIPLAVAQQMNKTLETIGMEIIRGAVDKSTVDSLRSHTTNPDTKMLEETGQAGDRKVLKSSTGNGLAGDAIYTRQMTKRTEECGSYYSSLKTSEYLDRLQKKLVYSLLHRGSRSGSGSEIKQSDADEVLTSRKYIILKYSNGGENWAHSDGNVGEMFPYQALLMLSSSDEYDGGEFYVANPTDSVENDNITLTRRCTPKLNAGDLVIFKANGKYNHGMKRVTRGERVAVGILQAG